MMIELEQVYAASAARLAPYRERARQRNELASAEQAVLLEDDVDAWKARYGADVTRWPVYGQAANPRGTLPPSEPCVRLSPHTAPRSIGFPDLLAWWVSPLG
jgi:hypothetical protein